MPPEPDSPERVAQRTLGDYIRDPARPPPPGIEARRLKVYSELFFNNVEGLLAGNFPVIRRILGDAAWPALVRAFYRDHPARTPLFTELAREFVQYLQTRAEAGAGDQPWLAELAHYEWAELALQIREAEPAEDNDPTGAGPLDGTPRLSPLAWPLHYRWPVHRIGPDHLPDRPPAEPTFLLLRRDRAGKVHFQQLSALTFRLLQRLREAPDLDGRAQLQALASEAAAPDVEAFVAQGEAMLRQLHRDGILNICGGGFSPAAGSP